MKLTIKNSKSMAGRDGLCWSCDLYIDGVKAAYVMDGGYGGEIDFDWYKPELERPFEDYVKTLPADKSPENIELFGPEGYRRDGSEVVADLCDRIEEDKRLKKWCKTKTVCVMKDSEKGNYTTFKAPFSPLIKTTLVQKYGDEIIEFVNERFV